MAMRGTLALTDAKAAQEAVDAYFKSRMYKTFVWNGLIEDGERVYDEVEAMRTPTTVGLAHALGVDRRTLQRYLKEEGTRDPELSHVLTWAWDRIAEYWEEGLATRDAVTGARFMLESQFGYKQDEEGQETGEGFTQVIVAPAEKEHLKAIPLWDDGQEEDT